MTKLKKVLSIFLTFIFFFTNFTYAALSTNTHFEVVDETKCEIKFGENGEFLKQIISYDESSVTLQLDVTNTADETIEKTTTEIFFVIDNSLSLNEQISDTETRKDAIYNAAKTLSTKLHTADSDFKIGVISFSSCSDYTLEGTIADATLKQSLTTDNNAVLNAIESINDDDFGSRTNIEAGLELANQNFSGQADKEYIILLTDGVPNDDIHGNTLQYSDIVIENTKNKLIELNNQGINIITVLSGVSSAVEPTVGYTYEELAEMVFGTEENPTAGKYYCINDSDIKLIIENDVYNDIEIIPGTTLTNIVIKDYFPQKIVDNFDFSYVTSPNIGTVSVEIDTESNCIIWTIESLEAGETATLQYKLTLKDNYSTGILDEILPTNEKVNITDDQGDDETSTDSPKVIVTVDLEEEPTPEEPDDTIIPDTVLPQTGVSNILIFSCVLIILLFGIYQYIKYKNV